MIFEGLKYPKSKAIYEKTNRITEMICKFMYFFIVSVVVPGFILPKAFYSFFIYFTTELGNYAFELPVPMWWMAFNFVSKSSFLTWNFLLWKIFNHARLPFDWRNPTGYVIAILMLMRIVEMPLHFIGCFVSLASACFLFSMSLAKDVQDDIHAINKNTRKKQTRADIHKQFIEFTRFTGFKRFDFNLHLFRHFTWTINFISQFAPLLFASVSNYIDCIIFGMHYGDEPRFIDDSNRLEPSNLRNEYFQYIWALICYLLLFNL